tara:strand:- start:689 stop:871 length:183 start_codon:yes stop_codon:yes gene_type:complete
VKLIISRRDRRVLKMMREHLGSLPSVKQHPKDKRVRYSKRQRNGVAISIRDFQSRFAGVW